MEGCVFDRQTSLCVKHHQHASMCATASIALELQAKRAMLALESLTPGGSEYVGDPDRCVVFVRETNAMQHHAIVKFKRERDVFQSHAAQKDVENALLCQFLADANTKLQALAIQSAVPAEMRGRT